MKKSLYAGHPEALAFIKKHSAEISPESYEDDASGIVSTSGPRKNTAPEGPDSKAFLDFIRVLTPRDQTIYREYLACKFGDSRRIAKKFGFPTHKHLLSRMRDLRNIMTNASNKYRVSISNRKPLVKDKTVAQRSLVSVQLGHGEDSETLHLILWENDLVWIDQEGCTFHEDILAILNNLYEAQMDFESLEVTVL